MIEQDYRCAGCDIETMELSRNGYCASCAEDYEPDWFDDSDDGA